MQTKKFATMSALDKCMISAVSMLTTAPRVERELQILCHLWPARYCELMLTKVRVDVTPCIPRGAPPTFSCRNALAESIQIIGLIPTILRLNSLDARILFGHGEDDPHRCLGDSPSFSAPFFQFTKIFVILSPFLRGFVRACTEICSACHQFNKSRGV